MASEFSRVRLRMRVAMIQHAEPLSYHADGLQYGLSLLDRKGHATDTASGPVGSLPSVVRPSRDVHKQGALAGCLTHARRPLPEETSQATSSSSLGDIDDAHSPDGLEYPEADLASLFAAAVAAAERDHVDSLRSSEAWPQLQRLLSLLVQAQRPLIGAVRTKNNTASTATTPFSTASIYTTPEGRHVIRRCILGALSVTQHYMCDEIAGDGPGRRAACPMRPAATCSVRVLRLFRAGPTPATTRPSQRRQRHEYC